MILDDIGFYTLCDERARNVSENSPMWRCEMIITPRCNFKCPYCRGTCGGLQGDVSLPMIKATIFRWAKEGLRNLRFSGGEPTLHPQLPQMVKYARTLGVDRIAISTNGSASLGLYRELIELGVNDISISLDGCCAADVAKMSGIANLGIAQQVLNNIFELSKMVYVTVGLVVTEDNIEEVPNIIALAYSKGVSDVRVIPAAQYDWILRVAEKTWSFIPEEFPILRYRFERAKLGLGVRGLEDGDSHRCPLVVDDSITAGLWHYPCTIYLREGGKPIGRVGPNMRQQRVDWALQHDTHCDPICKANCLDVCIDYNNRVQQLQGASYVLGR